MSQTATRLSPQEAVRHQQIAKTDPEYFFKYFLGCEAWYKQVEIAKSIIHNRETAVASCHAAGKSFIAARIAMWYLLTHDDSIVVSTAPTARQVEDVLWREIGTAYEKALIPLTDDRPLVKTWNISKNWYAVGLSTNEPDKFQGYHADSGNLLAIVDEAAGMEEPLFEAIGAILTSELCRLLMIGNPTSAGGTFRDAFRTGTANTIHISAFDTPNFTTNGIKDEEDLQRVITEKREMKLVAPYLISPIWVYERIQKWGTESPMYQARVLGQFPEMSEDTLIPLNWIEAAMEPDRHALLPKGGDSVYGVDVARFGSDRTVSIHRKGDIIVDVVSYHKQDTMRTANIIWDVLENNDKARVYVDIIGLGAGVVDRLHELQQHQEKATGKRHWTRVVGVNVGEKAAENAKLSASLEFANKRAELYWKLREKFERGTIALPKDDELANELSLIKYRFDSKGRLFIEEKAEIKKRLLKSPDKADALMLSYADTGVGRFVMDDPQPGHRDFEESVDRPITSGLQGQQF